MSRNIAIILRMGDLRLREMKLTLFNFMESKCQQRSSVGTSYFFLLPLQEEEPLYRHSAMKGPGVWRTVRNCGLECRGKW